MQISKISRRSIVGGCSATLIALFSVGVALAAPYETTVLTDKLTGSANHVVEWRLNIAKPGPRADSASGKLAQSLLEYSLGMSKTMQLSVQLQCRASRVAGTVTGFVISCSMSLRTTMTMVR